MPFAPLAYPGIKAVVQEDVGQERAKTRPLGTSRFNRSPFTAPENAGLQPSLNQAKNPRSAILCSNIRTSHAWSSASNHSLRHQRVVQAHQRFVCAAAWSKAIAEPVEVGLVDRIQDLGYRALDDLVLQGR